MCESPNCMADNFGAIDLLNAAHDVTCTGCGWCDWTGRARMLELTAPAGKTDQ